MQPRSTAPTPRVAFSTVACHDLTLRPTLELAARTECDGVEFRTFGEGSTRFANDPGLTGAEKVAALCRDAGVDAAGLATGITLHSPVFPPVIGNVFRSRWGQTPMAEHAIDLAARIGAQYVRVFPFEIPRMPLETRRSTLNRIAERLKRAANACRHKDVTLLIENAGDFATAEDLAEIIAKADAPHVAACYDLFAANTVEDDIDNAIAILGPRLAVARLRDRRGNTPALLGTGDLPTRDFVASLTRSGFSGWIVYEWERAWIDNLAPAGDAIPHAVSTIYHWIDDAAPAASDRAATPAFSAA